MLNEPVIKVPLIKNSRTLKVDDKLVLFVPTALSLNPKPALKKQKTMNNDMVQLASFEQFSRGCPQRLLISREIIS